MAGKATGIEVARISVKVSPDTRSFRRELKADLEAIEKSVKAKVDVEPNMTGFRSKVNAETKGMKAKVKVDADVDRGFFSRIADSISNIKGPDFGSGINAAGYAVILGGILAVAAPLIGMVTTALLALPGLVSMVAAPIAAITLGLDGIKNAAEQLRAPFERLREVMNFANEAAFTPVFAKLADLFPTLEQALPRVTQGMANFAQSIVDTVTAPEGLAKIDEALSNIGQAFTDMAPGIGDFTDGFLTLIRDFTAELPGLSEWFNGAGKDFKDWITELSESGDLSDAFKGLGDGLKTIAEALGGMAKEGMEFMSDPEKVDRFVDGLKQIGDTLGDIVELSNKLNELDLFSNMLPSLDMEGIKEDVLGPILSEDAGWRTAAAQASQFITQTFTTAFQTISSLAQSAVTGIVQAMTGMSMAVTNVWNGIVASAQSAWSGVTGAVQSAWESIKSAVQTGIEAVISFVSGMGGRIISAITSIDLGGAGRALMDGLLGGIKAGAEAVFSFVSSIAGRIADLKGPISYDKVVLIPNGQALMEGLGKGLENGFEPVLEQAKGMAGQIAEAFAAGGDPTGLLSGFSKKEIDRMEKALTFETRRLESQAKALSYQAKLADDDGLRAEADRLRMIKDELSMQKEMLGLTQEYSDELGSATSGDDPLVKAASGLMNAPVDFAKATGKQFLSDLGIGGDGLIGRALTEGIQYIFQIGSVDEAMSIKDREESKQALSFQGR